ncbi:hypothetical protein DUI87_13342 [Hirundo rustica rustica]|uniref:Uncharacterized protein n=1 Tax=Hirundo rustica rustica TaxID=333673 RepID=A0A3M0KTZ0_HIRRU|nr:hypothetical protein DUI87_13342 [Hirundo rustica rustica]
MDDGQRVSRAAGQGNGNCCNPETEEVLSSPSLQEQPSACKNGIKSPHSNKQPTQNEKRQTPDMNSLRPMKGGRSKAEERRKGPSETKRQITEQKGFEQLTVTVPYPCAGSRASKKENAKPKGNDFKQ